MSRINVDLCQYFRYNDKLMITANKWKVAQQGNGNSAR